MAAVTIQLIKQLQERTGAGIMDCKKALIEADADIEKAIDILREKGIAKAASKAGRTAAEGLAVIKFDDKKAVIAEINCETDFVSGSPKFHEMVEAIADCLLAKAPKDLEGAKAATQDIFTDAVVAMRENFVFRRYELVEAAEGQAFGSYLHQGGKIAALVVLSKDAGEVNRGLAMTVASADPYYLTLADVPAEAKARELAIAQKEVAEDPKLANKPDNVKEMIAQRKVESRLGENCLDAKAYALDPEGKLLVRELCKNKELSIVKFVRFKVGEGVEVTPEAE
ncbi:MAG: translation elongation factor Ts [Bacilli bacterium]|nr:translation elongation factor Ts [Bacilli bacterium]